MQRADELAFGILAAAAAQFAPQFNRGRGNRTDPEFGNLGASIRGHPPLLLPPADAKSTARATNAARRLNIDAESRQQATAKRPRDRFMAQQRMILGPVLRLDDHAIGGDPISAQLCAFSGRTGLLEDRQSAAISDGVLSLDR
jgi:hypothetical protein